MDKVLITGGTGFCGKWMCATAPDLMEITGFNREGSCQLHLLNEMYEFDYVVHLAPISPLDALERFPNARHLYVSSGAVYDQQGEYAENKRAWELECQASRCDFVIARPFSFIGSGLRGNGFAAMNFIYNAVHNLPMTVYGNGSTIRSYLHGSDLGKWLWNILLNGERGHAYDVGSGIPVTILELAQEVAKIKPVPIHILNNDHKETTYLPKSLSASWCLGCSQMYDLHESLEMTLQEMSHAE